MPPSGTRGRRGRGRAPWKRGSRPAASDARTGTEADSQQQSANRTSPSHDTRATAEERQRGARRKGRPPSKTRRGRILRQEMRQQDADDMDCDESGREVEDVNAHGNFPGNESSIQRISPVAASTSAKDDNARSPNSKPHDDLLGEESMDVESQADNTSETEESQVVMDPPSEVMSRIKRLSLQKTTEAGDLVPIRRGEVKASNYPFVVFEDGHGVLRARHATFVVPICVGSIAFWLGKKAPEKKCYKWMVYVRSPAGVDMSHIIRGVKFQLHQSFSQPDRFIEGPPYELEETGWGEFDIGISIEFHEDVQGQPIEITHSLKLYTTSEPSTRKPVISEKYDEIIFSEPPAAFFHRVRSEDDQRAPLSRYDAFFPRYDPHVVDDCMHRISLIRSRMRNEVRALLAKAEAKGIEIDLPEAKRMIEQPAAKDSVTPMTTADAGAAQTAPRPEVQSNTRIVIDADCPDQPLRIKVEPSGRSTLAKGSTINRPATQINRFATAFEMAQETFAPEEDAMMMDIDTADIGVEDHNGTRSMLVELDTFAVEESGSKASSKIEALQIYDEISSSGECPGHYERTAHPPASLPGSRNSRNRDDGEDRDSHGGSFSSGGGASRTHPAIESLSDPKDDLM